MSTRRVPKDLQICPKIWSNISPLFGWSHTLITILQTMLHMSHAVVIFRADDDVLQPASCGADEDIFPAWWELCWDIVGREILWMATMAKDDHHHRSVCVTELTRTLCATSCVCATLVEDNVKILGQQAKERTLVSSHCNMHYGARCTRTQSKQNACFVMLYTNHFISGGSSNSESLKGEGLPVSPSFPTTGFKGKSIDSRNQSTAYNPCV